MAVRAASRSHHSPSNHVSQDSSIGTSALQVRRGSIGAHVLRGHSGSSASNRKSIQFIQGAMPHMPMRMSSFGERISEALSEDEWLDPDSKRYCIQAILEGSIVKIFMTVIILLNAAQVIYESDLGSECRIEKVQSACDQESGWLRVMNWVYLGIYSIELGLRVFVHRVKSLTSFWDLFDGAIILSGVLSEAFGGVIPSTGILRLFRLARLVRAVRFIRFPPELHIMIHGFVSALKAISMGAVLVFLMLTLWSVVAVETLNDLNQEKDLQEWYNEQGCTRCLTAWSSVAHSVFSFSQLMLMGESWDLLAIPLIERVPVTLLFFVLVYFTVVLGMTNLILAVIVDKALQAHEEDLRREAREKEREKQRAVYKFQELGFALDENSDGSLSLEELFVGYEHLPSFRHVLDVMDVNRNEMEVLFRIMDTEHTGEVSYKQFAEELARLKNASLQTLASFTKHHVMETRLVVENIQRGLKQMIGEEFMRERSPSSRGGVPLSLDTPFTSPAGVSQPTDVLNGSDSDAGTSVIDTSKLGDAELADFGSVGDLEESPSNVGIQLSRPNYTSSCQTGFGSRCRDCNSTPNKLYALDKACEGACYHASANGAWNSFSL